MGFKRITSMTKGKQSTVEFADFTRTFGVRRAVIDVNYLAYFIERVMKHCNNTDTIEEELVRACAGAQKFDESSVPLTKKEKKIKNQITLIVQQIAQNG